MVQNWFDIRIALTNTDTLVKWFDLSATFHTTKYRWPFEMLIHLTEYDACCINSDHVEWFLINSIRCHINQNYKQKSWIELLIWSGNLQKKVQWNESSFGAFHSPNPTEWKRDRDFYQTTIWQVTRHTNHMLKALMVIWLEWWCKEFNRV